MGERTQYAPGTFSWTDLSTTDQDAAKAFYAGLFGWQAMDMPVDENTVYSMQMVDGKAVAAISPQPAQQREAGVPPLWNSYITVAGADAAADRAGELGGTVHAPPFDVMDAGRMAVIKDPTGAFFMVWEPRQNIGAGLVNVPGAMCWNELATPDFEAAQAFYAGLFGWSFEPFEGSEMTYFAIKNGDANNGGMRAPQPGEPPHWLVYFATEDTDGSLAKAQEQGGSPLGPAIDLPMGRIGVVRDPEGAVFALYAGDLEP
jgi:predicted enzyme related to lactoylglutathione lyase